MTLTKEEKDNLREVVQRIIVQDKSWLAEKDIRPLRKGDYWIANYGVADRNEFNFLTRGLVVRHSDNPKSDPLNLIASFPFHRFYNHGEEYAHSIDLNHSDMIEKLDGTMVGVFFPYSDWTQPECHTRRMLSTFQPDMEYALTSLHGKKFRLLKLISEYVNHIAWGQTESLVNYTLVFEFIHEASYVWTKYTEPQYGLYLLGGRCIDASRDFPELSEKMLDSIATILQVRRPRRWDAKADQEYIISLMSQMTKENEGFEGFVFRDRKTGKRVKLKDVDYVKASHALDNKTTYRGIVEKVLQGEEKEILAYYPEAKERIDKVKATLSNMIEETSLYVLNIRSNFHTKKDLALDIVPKIQKHRKKDEEREAWILSQTLILYDVATLPEIREAVSDMISAIGLGHKSQGGSPRKVVKLLNLIEEIENDNCEEPETNRENPSEL